MVIDIDAIAKHPRTTEEVRSCLKDIKVLGRKDLRMLMNWCTAVKTALTPAPAPSEDTKDAKEDDEDEEEDIDKQLAELKVLSLIYCYIG